MGAAEEVVRSITAELFEISVFNDSLLLLCNISSSDSDTTLGDLGAGGGGGGAARAI